MILHLEAARYVHQQQITLFVDFNHHPFFLTFSYSLNVKGFNVFVSYFLANILYLLKCLFSYVRQWHTKQQLPCNLPLLLLRDVSCLLNNAGRKWGLRGDRSKGETLDRETHKVWNRTRSTHSMLTCLFPSSVYTTLMLSSKWATTTHLVTISQPHRLASTLSPNPNNVRYATSLPSAHPLGHHPPASLRLHTVPC